MRPVVLALFVFCATAAAGDIAKPASLDETLELMLERILPTFPDARIDRADRNIKIGTSGEVAFNPDNIHAVLQTIENGAEREAELDRFVAIMVDATLAAPLDTSVLPLNRLYPVVRHASFVADSGAVVNDIYTEAFVGDLIRLYAIDAPDSVQYLTKTHLAEADATLAEIEQAAFANLAVKLEQSQLQQNGGLFLVLTDGFYESSMVLEANLWDNIAAQMGGEVTMIVPSRDLLVFGVGLSRADIGFINSIRDKSLQNGTHQLSNLTYVWRNQTWQVLPE